MLNKTSLVDIMGKLFSVLNRHIKRINVENRAYRVISKEKPNPAPHHSSSLKAVEFLEDPERVKEELVKKDEKLHEKLKHIYVTSQYLAKSTFGKPSEKMRFTSLNRKNVEMDMFGYVEPKIIPEGRISLRQAMKFLADHQGDPVTYSAPKISDDYKLAKDDAVNILQYFGTFKVRVREEHKKRKQLFGGKLNLAGFLTELKGSTNVKQLTNKESR